MSASADGTLLIVCAANVCRSPFAEFLFGEALPGVAVGSAGVSARPGDELCVNTAATIARSSGGARFVDSHQVTRIDASAVKAADLILTATESERAAVAAVDRTARWRTFTLIEAAHSARSISALAHDEERSALQRLAAAMHQQRGTVSLPGARGRSLLVPVPSYGIAVPDAHTGQVRRHESVHRVIRTAVGDLLDSLERLA